MRISRLLLSVVITAFVALTLSLLDLHSARAQSAIRVQCGTILENELAEIGDGHAYLLGISPGDRFTAEVQPIGETLVYRLAYEYDRQLYAGWPPFYRKPGSISSPTLSMRGDVLIRMWGHESRGAYKLLISCVLRDGTEIKPGSAAPVPTPQSGSPDFGFPGLAPVDFSNVAKIPMIAGTPMTGAVTATGGEILGYQFDGKANATLDLSFTRLSGNLNLGLVLLSADNKVVYQASLVTSSAMSTTLTLPSDGKYTVGVFRIDLLPPAAPEPTAFQVQVQMK